MSSHACVCSRLLASLHLTVFDSGGNLWSNQHCSRVSGGWLRIVCVKNHCGTVSEGSCGGGSIQGFVAPFQCSFFSIIVIPFIDGIYRCHSIYRWWGHLRLMSSVKNVKWSYVLYLIVPKKRCYFLHFFLFRNGWWSFSETASCNVEGSSMAITL